MRAAILHVAAAAGVLLLAAAAGPAWALPAPIVFDFEDQPVDSTQNGSLTTLTLTQPGLEVTITRSAGAAFDVLNPGAGGYPNAYPDGWGEQALSPFFAQSLDDFFIASFSIPVAFVSVESGDFGGDSDVIALEAFSNDDGTGQILPVNVNTDSVNWTSDLGLMGLGDPPVEISVGEPLGTRVIRSVVFRGGSANFPNSVYFDNLTVVVPEPTTALMFGCGLAGIAVVGRKRRGRSPRQLPLA